jgi:hypothetical protein
MQSVVFLSDGVEISRYLKKIGSERSRNVMSWYQEGLERTPVYERIAHLVVTEAKSLDRVAYLVAGGSPLFLDGISEFILSLAEKSKIPVHIFPSVSSFDTIVSDLRLVPTPLGFQCYEATYFYYRRPSIDPAIPLFLFQPGGFNVSTVKFRIPASARQFQPLKDLLLKIYSPSRRWVLVGSSRRKAEGPLIVTDVLENIGHHARLFTAGTLVILGED